MRQYPKMSVKIVKNTRNRCGFAHDTIAKLTAEKPLLCYLAVVGDDDDRLVLLLVEPFEQDRNSYCTSPLSF